MKVSVIIPNYNRANIIGETIENMLNQSLKPYEIIVIDDGSIDHSVQVIKKFGDKVKLIQQNNKGPGAARNAGLKMSEGDYIQFMDSDDLASLNKLEVQSQELSNGDADIIYGPWCKVWLDNQKRIGLQDVVLQQRPLPVEKSALYWFLTDWSMVFQQCLVRRKVLENVGGYREDIKILEDGDLFIRLLLSGAKLKYENKSLTLYRLNDFGKLTSSADQLSSQQALNQADFYISVLDNKQIPKEILRSTKFQIRLWNTYIDLQITSQESTFQYKFLKKQLLHSARKLKVMRLAQQKLLGLRSRIKGHRWSYPYQAGGLHENQEKLIREIGYIV